jgi:hypothetical protein
MYRALTPLKFGGKRYGPGDPVPVDDEAAGPLVEAGLITKLVDPRLIDRLVDATMVDIGRLADALPAAPAAPAKATKRGKVPADAATLPFEALIAEIPNLTPADFNADGSLKADVRKRLADTLGYIPTDQQIRDAGDEYGRRRNGGASEPDTVPAPPPV